MKEASEILVLEKYQVKIFEENDYKIDSSDNWWTYSSKYINGDESSSTCLIGIQIFDDDNLIENCIIGAEGGGIGVNPNSTLISYGGVVVCCSNTVFKLTLPDLNLEWKTISDSATCFGIHYLDKGYVVHGEMEITRLDKDGEIVWKKSGRDIWTTAESYDDFAVYDDYILATDWEYNRYKFDFNGNLLEDYKIEPLKNQNVKEIKQVKKWWEFWK